jgi:hypothetical protein
VIRHADNIASVGFESSRAKLQSKGQTNGVSGYGEEATDATKHTSFSYRMWPQRNIATKIK